MIATEEPKVKMVVKAYPNPFENSITIAYISPLEEEANIIITDVAGREVQSMKNSSGSVSIGSDLRPGVYFVLVIQGQLKQAIKIMKNE